MRCAALLLLAGLAGCATVDTAAETAVPYLDSAAQGAVTGAHNGVRAARRAASGPHLSPVGDPTALAGPRPISMPGPQATDTQPAGANSLWRSGGRTFFNDQRANRIGDILTVKVAIDDSATLDNASNRSRTSDANLGVTSLFGKEEMLGRLLPPGGAFDPASMVGAQGETSFSGQGAIIRKEKIELTLAATIADVLPNGNLLVAGRQQVLINGEMRELTIAGVLRPEDVSADNSIRHDQLAEARISYGGRGTVSTVQRPGWLQRGVDAIAPW